MGITYLAQVLKRNRTLKVLNLSENKLDVSGLVAIAEALVSPAFVFEYYTDVCIEIQFLSRDIGPKQEPMLRARSRGGTFVNPLRHTF